MLKIKPIQSKDEQANYCQKCNISYDPDCMAYSAYEDEKFLGVCQFKINHDAGYIRNLAEATGVSDFEAMFIMARAAMNFIDLCEMHFCTCASDATSETLIKGLGFKKREDGVYFADMTHFFDGGNCASKHKDN